MAGTDETNNRMSSLSFGEALSIGFFRYIEEKYPDTRPGHEENEDIPLLATEKNSLGRLVNPTGFLARRAEILLPKRTPLTRKGLERYANRFLHWMPILIVVCGLAFFPLGKIGSILSGKEVNLAGGFFWFLCGQLFFLACSFFFLSLFLVRSLWNLLFARHAVRSRNAQGFLSKMSSLTGYVVFRLPDWWDSMARAFHRMFGRGIRRKPQRDASETDSFGVPYVDFLDYLFSHRAATYFLTGFYSHLFWLCTSLGILMLLFVQMWSNEYKYSCRTSLGDVDHVRTLVQFFGYPFQRVVPLPDDHDIEWLFQQRSENSSGLHAESKVSRTRVHWSHFLLATFFTWAVLPRLCMVLIYGLALRVSLQTFRPRLKDDYYVKIVQREENAPRQIVRQQVFDEDETPGHTQTYRAGPSRTPVSRDLSPVTDNAVMPAECSSIGKLVNTTLDDSGCADSSIQTSLPEADHKIQSEPTPGTTVVFGIESRMSQARWQVLFPQTQNLVCFDDIAVSAQARNDFAAWLECHGKEISRCVMLTDCSCPPARQLTLYLQKRVLPCLCQADFVVILSRGERLREKFRNNSPAIGQRLQDWNDQLESLALRANVRLTIITYYDHDLDLAAARNRLATQLAGNKTNETCDRTKLAEASQLVMRDVNVFFASAPVADDEVLTRLSRFYENLTKIYQEESRSFLEDATATLPPGFDAASIRQHGKAWLGSLERVADGFNMETIQDQLVPAAAVMNRMRQLSSRLSPRCALCAASIAATLPVAAVIAPLAVGTLSVASIAAVVAQLGTILPSVAVSGALGGAAGAVLPLSFDAVKNQFVQGFSHLVGSSRSTQSDSNQNARESDLHKNASSVQLFLSAAMTWVAIFEFQGTEQSQVADMLNDVLAPLEEDFLLDKDRANDLVSRIVNRIAHLKNQIGNAT